MAKFNSMQSANLFIPLTLSSLISKTGTSSSQDGCRYRGEQSAGGDSISYRPPLTGLGALLPQAHMESLLFSSPIPEFQSLRTNACFPGAPSRMNPS